MALGGNLGRVRDLNLRSADMDFGRGSDTPAPVYDKGGGFNRSAHSAGPGNGQWGVGNGQWAAGHGHKEPKIGKDTPQAPCRKQERAFLRGLDSKNGDEEGLKSIVGGSWGALLGSRGSLVNFNENPGHFLGFQEGPGINSRCARRHR